MSKHGTPVRPRFDNDAKGLAHWIARKVNNHDPMRDRVKASLRLNRGFEVAFVAETDQQTVLYRLPDGRQFVLSVREITGDTVQTEPFVHA